MFKINLFSRKDLTNAPAPNYWDVLAFVFIVSVFFAVAWLLQQMVAPFSMAAPISVDLSPYALPGYCLRSVSRICIALFFSFVLTFILGATAAKSQLGERIIIPAIDVLQSVPVLGFLSVGVWGFLVLFPGSWLGPECAAIFAILTAQVWNMIFSFYQSLSMVPKSLYDSARILHLSSWHMFWRIEVPYAMPSLLWNCMLSISASWFFMVASEAIEVNKQVIMLPGVGSYIGLAIQQADMVAVCWAVSAMFLTIIIYDQVFFRPIMQWGEKFQPANHNNERHVSLISRMITRAGLLQFVFLTLTDVGRFLLMSTPLRLPAFRFYPRVSQQAFLRRNIPYFWALVLCVIGAYTGFLTIEFFREVVTIIDLKETFWLGAISALRIFVVVSICIIVWVPVGVWIGLRPHVARRIQPIIQILSAFPANLLFPFFASWIWHYQLNTDIWLSPLTILGTQWYVLFNVIAGTMALPEMQKNAVAAFGVRRMLWWRKFIIPGISSHLITGAMTAMGGAWNISIIAEAINWGGHDLYATGLGAYITYHTREGNSALMALGIVVMCFYVLLINRIFWQPLYHFVQNRFPS